MSWEALKSAVTAVITANGNKEITGSILQNLIVNNLVPQLGASKFKGVAELDTTPGTPETPDIYFAYKPGIYSNFGGLELDKTGLYFIEYNTSTLNWVVYDLLSESENLKSLTEVNFKPGKNLVNKNDLIEGQYVSYGGSTVNGIGSNTAWKTTNYISVLPNTIYTRSAVSGDRAIAFFDTNFNYLSGVVPSTQSESFTTPADTAYLIANYALPSTSVNLQIEIGNIASDYEDFVALAYNKNTNIAVSELYNALIKTPPNQDNSPVRKLDLDTKLGGFPAPVGDNLFNPGDYVTGGYVNDSNGVFIDNRPQAHRTGFIKVTGGENLFFAGAGDYFRLHTYSTNDVSSHVANIGNVSSYIIPSGVNYIACTITFSDGDTNNYSGTFQINRDSLKPYSPYLPGLQMDENVKVSTDNIIGLGSGSEITKRVTVANSDKIVVFGNSYSQGYSLVGKHYIQKLGMFLDYQFRNFGKSGDDLIEIMGRIRSNSTWFGNVPISEFKPTYGIIACRDNNFTMSDTKPDTYFENAKKLAREIETLGGRPILSSEHQHRTAGELQGLDRLSNSEGYDFMNWGKFSQKSFNSNYFRPLWFNNHPGTRTNDLWAMNMLPFLKSLPRPKQGIKVFRKRSGIAVSDINSDLIFENTVGRAKLFQEIFTGHTRLTLASEKFVDRCDDGSYTSQDCEYLKLQSKQSIGLGDYFLIQTILPCTATSLESLDLFITANNVSNVYIKKTLGLSQYNDYVDQSNSLDPYYASFENPLGEWVEVVGSTGKYSVPLAVLRESLQYDKLSFLVKSNGTDITVTDVFFDYVGGVEKVRTNKPLILREKGTELLSNVLFDTGWTSVGTPTNYTPVTDPNTPANSEFLPSGVTTVKEIDDTNYLTQNLTDIVNNTYSDNEVQIKILCRYFPEFVDNDSLWASSHPLNGDKYFYGDLEIILENTSFAGNDKITVGREVVGLYWHEIRFNFKLTNDTGNKLILKSLNSKKIQVAKCEVTLLD